MSFSIEITETAKSDIEKHKKAGDKKILNKINELLLELRVHPKTGTGRPELLKHYIEPTWSRRISDKHRLVYRIHNETVVVLVLALWGHYGDK